MRYHARGVDLAAGDDLERLLVLCRRGAMRSGDICLTIMDQIRQYPDGWRRLGKPPKS